MRPPEPRAISPTFSTWLDFLRWTAALAVCLAHTRAGVMVDFDAQVHPGWLARLVYFLPGFAHSAVMVFFVLSGYLVGGEILRACHRGDFSWRNYAARRLARLYAAYAAALLLCVVWDHTGLQFFNARHLYSAHDNFITTITYPINERLGLGTLLGNLFFCQTVLVDTYGSNGALWSLANEAWYYALFPLALWPLCAPAGRGARALCGIFFIAGAWFVGREILLYFSVWLMGLLPHFLPRRLPGGAGPPAAVVVALLLIDRLHLFGILSQFGHDFLLAVALAWLLHALESLPWTVPGPARLHQALADFSFTVYLLHWPLALLLIAMLDQRFGLAYRMPFSPAAVAILLLLLAVIYAVSWAVSQLTERQTPRVRAWLLAHTRGPGDKK